MITVLCVVSYMLYELIAGRILGVHVSMFHEIRSLGRIQGLASVWGEADSGLP